MNQDIEATTQFSNDDVVNLFSGDLLSEFKMYDRESVTVLLATPDARRREALESEILRRLRLVEPKRFT